jgi:O-succinylbenzoate synthase
MPLRRPIPVGATFWRERQVVLIRGEDADGRVAWGEAAPLDGYGPDTLDEVRHALSRPSWTSHTLPASLACAVGTIQMGLRSSRSAAAFGQPDFEPASRILVPAMLGAEANLTGVTHVKIKTGRTETDEGMERIRSLCAKWPNVRIRLDGNGLMTQDEALKLTEGLGDLCARVDFFEEPWQDCFEQDIRGILPVPVAIDESLRGENWHHADVSILKPSLMGDPRETVILARGMQEAGRRVTVSSAFESRVGMIMITRLAALIGDTAPGLGTYRFMADDWGGRPAWWDAPRLDVGNLPMVPDSPADMKSLPLAESSGLKVEEIPA